MQIKMVLHLYSGTHGKPHGLELTLIRKLVNGELMVEKVEDSNVELSLQLLQLPQNKQEQVLDIE